MFSHALVRLAAIIGILWAVFVAGASIWLVVSYPGGDLASHWWKFVLVALGPLAALVLVSWVLTAIFEPGPPR